MRTATLQRDTKETRIGGTLKIEGRGRYDVHTGIRFFDHMLELFTKHGGFDLTLHADGDLDVDQHHTVEDVGIVIGQAIEKAIGDKKGIYRYGWAIVPMDESLAQVAVDLSGRPAFVYNVSYRGSLIGNFPVELVDEFFKSIATNAKMNLHINVPYGTNNHHIAEAIFKGFAKALRQAIENDPRNTNVPSTKGSL